MLLTRKLLNQGFLLVKLKALLVYARHGYVPLVVSTSGSFLHAWLITGLFVTKLTQLVSLLEQELLKLPVHLRSPSVCSGIRVTRSLVVCVCFVDRCLLLCAFSFGHYVICSSLMYEFWLPLRHLQTLLTINSVFHIMLIIRYNDMQDLELSKFRVRLVVCSS